MTPAEKFQHRKRLWVSDRLSSNSHPIVANADVRHYLLRVLRLRLGDKLSLFNGCDGEWTAVLEGDDSHHSKHLALRPMCQVHPQPARLQDVCLAIPPLRKSRMEWLAEKASELGIAALVPLRTRRTAHQFSQPERLLRIMTEAAEQSERMTVPKLEEEIDLATLLNTGPPARKFLACIERESQKTPFVVDLKTDISQNPNLCLIVGPEGGFDENERRLLIKGANVSCLSLGARVLRSETAAIVALGGLNLEM